MNSRILKSLIAGLAIAPLFVAAVACGSQDTDEPALDDGPAFRRWPLRRSRSQLRPPSPNRLLNRRKRRWPHPRLKVKAIPGETTMPIRLRSLR